MASLINRKKLVKFLEKCEFEILQLWEKNIIIDKDSAYFRDAREYAFKMYSLIKNAVNSNFCDEEAIKKLAFNVANQRMKENTSIGEFVHNVNIARSYLSEFIFKASHEIDEIKELSIIINSHYDSFSYHAVTEFTKLKDKELQEKSVFINDTHKDRLTILGQLSSSFVHEFRNPLTSVIGFVKLIKQDHPQLNYLDLIDLELEQLKFRITQFLHTSRVDMIKQKSVSNVSVNQLLKDIIEFLYPSLVDGSIDVISDFECQCDSILNVNMEEIKQVFLNILTNSIDALKDKNGSKEIYVNCTSKNDFVCINISNNGPKIPSGTMKSIFEPFYTTKDLGTGIGLHVCKQIIENHNGKITCKSSDDLTTFSIYLPKE